MPCIPDIEPRPSSRADMHVQSSAAASRVNDFVTNSDHHGLGAGHRTKLRTKILDVLLDRSAADVKRLANLPRRFALGGQGQDLPLTRRQLGWDWRGPAMKFQDSIERVDRHQVQGRQLVLWQIERPASEPYLPHPARRRSHRDQETIQYAEVTRTLHHFGGAGLSLGIVRRLLNHRNGRTAVLA
jgi:hypothetical protein